MTEQTKIDIVKSHREINKRMDKFEKSVLDELIEIKNALKPLAETYGTVIKIGKWAKWLLAFVLLVVSVLLGIKALFK